MNTQSQTTNKNLTLITKNGSIHLGLVEGKPASAPTTDTIQLELDFNQPTTNYY